MKKLLFSFLAIGAIGVFSSCSKSAETALIEETAAKNTERCRTCPPAPTVVGGAVSAYPAIGPGVFRLLFELTYINAGADGIIQIGIKKNGQASVTTESYPAPAAATNTVLSIEMTNFLPEDFPLTIKLIKGRSLIAVPGCPGTNFSNFNGWKVYQNGTIVPR